MKNLLLLLLTSLLCVQCSWFKKDDPKPKLPPATREGKNTFGCYVNGYPWVPAGRPSLFQSNLRLIYDPGFAGGSFDLRAHRGEGGHEGYINLVLANVNKDSTYLLGGSGLSQVRYLGSCDYWSTDADVTSTGTLTITRLDLQARVVAGTFEFTMSKPGCDTVKVTEGRFDMPLY